MQLLHEKHYIVFCLLHYNPHFLTYLPIPPTHHSSETTHIEEHLWTE
jgi:hypothetical protein